MRVPARPGGTKGGGAGGTGGWGGPSGSGSGGVGRGGTGSGGDTITRVAALSRFGFGSGTGSFWSPLTVAMFKTSAPSAADGETVPVIVSVTVEP
jgi:hypothetical protein